MKNIVPLFLTTAVIFSACSDTLSDKQTTQQQPTQISKARQYQCESGQTIVATYPSTDSASVQYQGKSYQMKITISASGARYVGSGLEWWTKGSGKGAQGSLFKQKNGSTGEMLESCTAN